MTFFFTNIVLSWSTGALSIVSLQHGCLMVCLSAWLKGDPLEELLIVLSGSTLNFLSLSHLMYALC
jgi:hypothetical protein